MSNSSNKNNIIHFKKQLDFTIQNQEKRVEKVKDILHKKNGELEGFFFNYLENFNVNINQNDDLSDKNYVSRELEKMANYILFCPGAEKINKKTTKYNFYTEKNFKKLSKKEVKIKDVVKNNNVNIGINNSEEEVIDFLIRKGNNYKKQIKQKIYNKDFNIKLKIDDSWKNVDFDKSKDNYNTDEYNLNYIQNTTPIKEYQDSINQMKDKLGLIRKDYSLFGDIKKILSKNGIYKDLKTLYVQHMEYCKTDQILCKDKILGTIYFKNVLPDSYVENDYDLRESFDFFDKTHVMLLLKCKTKNLDSDIGMLVNDLEKILNRIDLTQKEIDALKLYRDDKLIHKNIAKKLEMTRQGFYSIIDSICEKIINKYEDDYEDWYYTYVVKGKYKKCSSCRKIKIANERHFDRDEGKKDGFKYICKICRRNN